MFHLAQSPRRAPFSDWKAQVERMIMRHAGPVAEPFSPTVMQSCYDVGLSPSDMAEYYIEDILQ